MAPRVNKIRHDEETRSRIQVGNIVNRLEKFIAGEIKMESAAVTAALGLLKKVLPDLTSVEHSGDVTTTYVARIPSASETIDAWQQQHTPPQLTKQ